MVTTQISALHVNTKNILKIAGIENYRVEAAILLEHFLGIKRHDIANFGERTAALEAVLKLKQAVEKRISGYPLQYILGEWEFYGYRIFVGEGVLIPRQDTETVVDTIIEIAKKDSEIIDLCSGSGCIAIALDKEIENANVYAVEKSEQAFAFLTKNIILNNSKVKPISGDVLDSRVIDDFPEVDIIVSNPPYVTDNAMLNLQREVAFEPKMALEGGEDGLYFYREMTSLWKNKVKKGGYLVYEIGMGQEFDVAKILTNNGFLDIQCKKDLCGITRVVYGTK